MPADFYCQDVVQFPYTELQYNGEASSAQRIFVMETCWETQKTGHRMHDDGAIHKLNTEI
jgi:ketosteroid isomerase-like protein